MNHSENQRKYTWIRKYTLNTCGYSLSEAYKFPHVSGEKKQVRKKELLKILKKKNKCQGYKKSFFKKTFITKSKAIIFYAFYRKNSLPRA